MRWNNRGLIALLALSYQNVAPPANWQVTRVFAYANARALLRFAPPSNAAALLVIDNRIDELRRYRLAIFAQQPDGFVKQL
jgi:hypothetical protein